MIKPQTRYYARVKAVNQSSESDYSNVISITTLPSSILNAPDTAPLNPTIYKVITSKNYSKVYIEKPLDSYSVQEYKVSLSTVSDFSTSVLNNLTYKVTNLPVISENGIQYHVLTLVNLAAGINYFIRLQSSNTVALSGITTANFSTESQLDKPVLLGATSLSSINAVVEWAAVSGAISYRLDVSTLPTFSSFTVNNITVNSTSFNIQALTETTTYYYRVRAFNGTVLSSNSNVGSFTTLNGTSTYTGQAVQLGAPVISNNKKLLPSLIGLKWQAIPEAATYSVQVATSPSFSTILSTVSSYIPEIELASLTPGTLYFIRIRAEKAGLAGPNAVLSVTTPSVNTALVAPNLINPSANYSTKAVLSWVKRQYATNYYLELSSASNFASISHAFYLKDIDTYEVTGLPSASTYYARVTGVNYSEVSIPSAFITFSTSAALPVLTGYSSQVRQSDVVLQWNPSIVYTKYLVTVYVKSSDNVLTLLHPSLFYQRDVANSTSFIVDVLLKPETSYQWLVEAVTATGDIYTSTLQSFTTKAKAPNLQLNSSLSRIEWSGQMNRLTVALDREFSTCLPGWIDRQLDAYNVNRKAVDIGTLLESHSGIYIKGRYVDINTISEYSNTVESSNGIPVIYSKTVTDTSFTIKWFNSLSTSYGVRVDEVSSTGVVTAFHLYRSIVDIGETPEFNLAGLTPGNKYRVYIYYRDSSTFKYIGSPVNVQLNRHVNGILNTQGSGNVPVTVITSNIDYDRLLLSVINSNSNSITALQVSRTTSPGIYERYLEVPAGTLSVEIDCQPSTAYVISAASVNNTTLQRSAITTVNATTLSIPYVPINLISAPILSNLVINSLSDVVFNFTSVLDAVRYRVEVSTSNTFSILEYDITDYTVGNKIYLQGLLPTSTYYVRVLALNEYSISPYSNVLTIDTTP